MCGIIAYKGKENAVQIVMDGLKHLEYRGYDSAGLCIISKNKTFLIKKVGEVENLLKEVNRRQTNGKMAEGETGIGHCFHPNTLVQLSNGKVVYIKDVVNGERIVNLNTKNLVLENGGVKVFKHKSPSSLYHVRTPLSNFVSTSNHKNLVWEESKIVEKLTKDLKKKDLLIFPKQIDILKTKPLQFKSIFYKRYYTLTSYGASFLKNQINAIGLNKVTSKIAVSSAYLNHILANDRNFREDQLKLLYNLFNKSFKEVSCSTKFPHLKPVNTIHGKFIKLPESSNLPLMQILGYFIGDGHAGKRSLRFKDMNVSNLKIYKGLIEKEFNIKGHIIPQNDTKAMLLEFNSTYLCNWLKVNIVENKHDFLSNIGQLPNNQLAVFIKGLFDAEGCVSLVSRQLCIGMIDEFLIRSLQLWLLRFGIIPSIIIEPSNLKWRRPNKTFRLNVSNKESIELFKKYISFGAEQKKNKLTDLIKLLGNKHFSFKIHPFSKQIILTRVKDIQQISSDTKFVYDLEVKGNHNFLANGIFTHNSRWATHGKVSVANAHPHFSGDKNIFVVHNGIVENYEDLKEELIKKGHHFVSQTDTEVIPHLIEEYSKNNSFIIACEKTFRRLKGLFAVVVLDKKTGEIIGTRKGSPLIMGIGDKGLFLASDVPAFLNKTNKVIFLDDGDMVHIIDGETYKIKNLSSKKILKKKIDTIKWTQEEAEKGKHPHFMIKEIKEIPEAIEKAVCQDNKKLRLIANLIKKSSNLFFVACGTAGHACLAGQYLFSSVGKSTGFSAASEFKNFLPTLDKKTLLIAVSQSGETIDVIEAVKKAKEKGIKVVSLVNVMGSTLTRISDYVLMINAGPEKCVLATKSYLSQLSLIILLFYSIFGQYKKGEKDLKKISRQINQLIENKLFISKIKRLAKKLSLVKHIYVIGRSYNYPTTLETALKIKEGCYIHTEAFAGGELKHGVIALIEKGTPCIIHLSKGDEEENTLINAMELKSRGAYIIGIGPEQKKDFDFFVEVPETEEIFSLLVNIVPIMLLSYYIALEKGIDPDKPRNLAKSVTVK